MTIDNCSICLQPVTETTSLNNLELSYDPKKNLVYFKIQQSCAHLFCNDCIRGWTYASANIPKHLCPNCKVQYTYLNFMDTSATDKKTKIVYTQTLNNLSEDELISFLTSFVLDGQAELMIKMIKDKQCNVPLKKLIDKLIESQCLTVAEKLCSELSSDDEKSRYLAGISKSYISTSLQCAIRAANDIPDKFLKAMALFEVAKAYISKGEMEAALLFLSNAVIIANEMLNNDEKSLALLQITYEYIKIQHLAEAKTASDKIPNDFVRTNALTEISRGYFENNDLTKAKDLLTEAEKIADELSYEITDKKFSDSDEKSSALSAIASAYVSAKNFDEANRITNKISNKSLKIEVMFEIAEAYIKENKTPEASHTLNTLEKLAKEISEEGIDADSQEPDEKSKILSKIVDKYLSINNFVEAQRVLNSIPNKLSKYTAQYDMEIKKFKFDHNARVKKIIESLTEQ
ncbi:MAG: hypothetical protein WCT85_05230 [Parachlamydiales bacterium]|jgi:tetratricopeptide (TPR) repeat protein